jgi:uncharacterized protein YjbI with pentapeptide repeats
VVTALYEKVQTRSLVAVVGASGSGKSSLVFAGLQPRLKAEGWLVEDCRPGNKPFYRLAEAFVRLLEPKLAETDLVKKAISFSELIEERGIGEVVARLTHKYAGQSLLIVVDQFEELFTLCEKDQRESFLKTLLDGLTKAVGLKLIVTLRADFCGQAYGDRTLTDAFQDAQLLVGPMNSGEFQAAIEQPAKLSGLKLEPGLTDLLLQDVGQQAGNLPLLEFALMQLWERQQNGWLTHQAYTDIRRVKGALAQYADQVYARLSTEQQQQTPQVFTKLVRLGVGTEDTRKVATRSQVGNWELVTILANERLVVTGRDEQRQEDTVEVIHEALIREWKLLREWVDENRYLGKLIQTVEDARQIWREGKKQKDLLEGRLLKEAKQLLKKRVDVPEEVQSFIRKSLRWRRSQMAGLLVIPVLVLGIPAEYFWREEAVKRNYDQIEKCGSASIGKMACQTYILSLIGGCRGKWVFPLHFKNPNIDYPIEKVLGYPIERIVGNCRPLDKANLNNSHLPGANLSNSFLHSVNLRDSNLRGAELRRVNLENADLSNADLGGANLSNSHLVGGRLIKTILHNAELRAVNLDKADLSNADLGGANLSNESHLVGCKLIKTRLNNTQLIDVNLESADLSGADLTGANLSNSRLHSIQMKNAKLNNTNLTNVNLDSANLSNLILQNVVLYKSYLHGVNLSNSILIGTNLSGVDLADANLKKAKFGCFTSEVDGKKICSNLKDIKWNKKTNWQGIQGWETVENIPFALKQQLGLKVISQAKKIKK